MLLHIATGATVFSGYAQSTTTIHINGIVKDATDNQPLPGVSVINKLTASGSSTDNQGRFSIDIPVGGTIVYRMLGYKAKEIVVKPMILISKLSSKLIKKC